MSHVRSMDYAAGYGLVWFKIIKNIIGKKKIQRATWSFMATPKDLVQRCPFKQKHVL